MHQIQIDRNQGNKVFSRGKSYTFFGGTAYLGIPYNSDFQKYLRKGIQLFGGNYGSSRAGNILPEVYPEAESILSDYLGMEKALTFSSGFLAAHALMQWLESQKMKILKINGDHPCLKASNGENMYAIPEDILDQIQSEKDYTYGVITTSVNPLTGEVYSFDWIGKLNRKIILIIDDSHGLGVLGDKGRGSVNG